MKKSVYRAMRALAVLLLSAAAVPLLVATPAAADEAQWVQKDSGLVAVPGTTQKPQLNQVYFASELVGYATGENDGTNGVLLKTEDGGATWTDVAPTNTAFNGVFFLDEDNGWVTGEAGGIYKTTDGGENWTDQSITSESELRNIWMVDATTGWIVGNDGTILHTTDGSSWTQQGAGLTTSYIFDVVFADDDTTGFVFSKSGQIIKTTNAGAAWAVDATGPAGAAAAILNAEIFGNDTMWICGAPKGGTGFIANSTDGGDNWALQTHPLSGSVYEVRAISADVAFAAGDGMLSTVDGGETWEAMDVQTPGRIRGLYMINEELGFGVGDNGAIIKWSTETPPPPTTEFSSVGGTAFTVGEEVVFANEATNVGDTPTYLWDFGDGETSTDSTATHTYDTAGLYDVSLTVTNEYGPDVETKEDFLFITPAGTAAVDPGVLTGVNAANADETIMMNFPAASTAKRCAVTFTDVTTSPADAPEGYSLADTMFSISIEDEDGEPVTTCIDNPETDTITEVWNVIVEYSDDDVEAAGGNAAALVLAYYDATAEEWEVMDSRVMATTGTVSAQTEHVSTWAVMVDASVPSTTDGSGCCASAAATAADIASSVGLVGMLGLAATYLHIRKRRS